MSITLTTIPLTTSSIQVDWSYSTFDEVTVLQQSIDGTNFTPVSGSPFAKGVTTTNVTGLIASTKYYYRIKKQVWVAYSKSVNGETL